MRINVDLELSVEEYEWLRQRSRGRDGNLDTVRIFVGKHIRRMMKISGFVVEKLQRDKRP
jgi:hypothetical protein